MANLNGVLIYDGINWQHCKRKDEISIQCIAKTTSGKIVVGTEDGDIAIIDKDKRGKYYYASLIENLPVKNRPQKIIRQIIILGESTFFLSADKLIELKNSEFKVYNPTENFHTRAFVMGKHLFITDINNAIYVLENGVLKPVLGTEQLSVEKHFFCYQLNKSNFAIGYRNIGTYIARYDSINPTKTIFEKKESQCDDEFIFSEINNGCLLKNGNFIVTTNKRGAFELDKNLTIVGRLNSKNGVYDDNIKSAFQDVNGNLWLSLYYGVAFVEINSKLFKYNRNNNILGIVASAAYFENKLFIATDKGVQYYDSIQEKFVTFQNFNKQSWNLLTYNKKLFICTDKGLFVFFNNQLKQITETKTSSILNDKYQPDLIYCATDNGVDVYHVSQNEVTYIKSYQLNSAIKSLATDANRNIYFATENNGIYFLNYNNSYLLDSIQKKDGLPNQIIENYVFTYKNKLLIGTDSGIYCVKKIKNNKLKCIKHPKLWSLTKGTQIFRASQLANDLICSQKFETQEKDKTEEKVAYLEENNNTFKLNYGILNRLKDVTPTLITYDSVHEIVFICANEGLFILNNKKINLNKRFNLILREFITKKDTVLENYLFENQSGKINISIPYKNNDIILKLGFTSYENSNYEFCHMLVGKDKDFNAWNKETKLSFSNLFEGDYTLIIKAKIELTAKIFELKIPFTVLPPWYRTIWAYIIYAILFILFLFIIIKLNSKRLIAKNLKLEDVIKQRTSTINEQVILLEHKNKEITDSINYAKRLQKAILPQLETIKKSLPQSFVLYLPKDIIAGDFYWFHQEQNKIFIAAADCTGHGVPGAMVSIVCSKALNQAVSEFSIFDTGAILDKTRDLVLDTFSKSGEDIKDGMDISLACIDYSLQTITWSGANNPLWIIKNNNLIEVKANKQPIGKADNYLPFTTNVIPFEKNMMLYFLTDGYADQFGGPKGKKYKYKQLSDLLISNCNSSPLNQQQLLEESFASWKGNLEQVDDVTIIGIRV